MHRKPSLPKLFGAALLGGVLLAAGLVATATTAWAAEFPFERNEVIRLIVPYGPGGGFDRILRVIQPSFRKALTQLAGGREVNVLVENRPGAGGRVAYEYVFNAEPDGTRMVLLGDQGAALQQVALGANFALDRFTYLAQVNQSDWGILIRTNTGIKDMNDLIRRAQQKPILVGTSGVGSGDHIASTIVQSILQKNGVSYPLQFVHFKGSKPVFASMQREEAELYIGSVESTLPATKEDYARIIVVFTRERNVYFPDTSTVFEQKIPGAEEMAENLGITRVLVGPPGIPADRVNVLREGLRMAMNDPELLEAARTAKLPVNYGGPEEGKASVRGHSGGVLNYKDVVLKAMEGK